MPERKPPDRAPRKKPPQPAASETLRDARAANPPPGPDIPPKRIGRFEVRALLGEGAFGRVYLAFDAELERQVAIKVPKKEGFTPEMRERFVREARATAKIHHPNVCPVYEVGAEGDVPFIVMHYQPGTTLAAHLDKWNVLAPLNAVALAQRLALGVAAAHEQGVIHRDLKPQNVLFEPAKQLALITDFGLARIGVPAATVDGAICGTPAYMSPEQASGKQDAVGPHSDVYALGVILYRMLTGDVPFRGRVFEVLAQHALAAPPPPSALRPGLDPRLDALVLKAMAKKPTDRFPSAKAFAEALAEYTRGGPPSWSAPAPVLASAPAPPPLPKPAAPEPAEPRRAAPVPPRRKVVWISLGGVIAVLLLAIVVLSVRPKKPSDRPPEADARGLKDSDRIELDRLRAEQKRHEDERAAAERKGLFEAARLVGETAEAERIELARQYVVSADEDFFRGNEFEAGRGVKQDYEKAKEWYEKAATRGHQGAQFALGYLYERGLGGKRDYEKAKEWYEKAAAQGDPHSQNNLGYLYERGCGVKQDYVKAREWYEKAAAQGYGHAQSHLGALSESGLGVKQDLEKAREWYEKAAAQGNMFGQHNLGRLYESGIGVKQDYEKAKEWYEKSAVQGNPWAQNNLGSLYENGRGVMKDLARALEWYEKAAAQGVEPAKDNAARLKMK